MIDRAGLMEGGNHFSIGLSERHIPRADLRLRRCGYHEVEAVGELLEDDDGPGKQTTLAVDLGAHVLADGGPPDVASRDERRHLSALMQFLFEADPLEKAVHVTNDSTRLKDDDLGDGGCLRLAGEAE